MKKSTIKLKHQYYYKLKSIILLLLLVVLILESYFKYFYLIYSLWIFILRRSSIFYFAVFKEGNN